MRSTLVATLLLLCASASAQFNIDLLGQLNYQALHNSELSDVWGYADEFGNEYAIVGVNSGGTSIVDVTDAANPVEIFFSAGPNTIWRDIKTWGDYAYITNESSGGLKIIDMSGLPDDTNLPVTTIANDGWSSAHNLFIDEFGYCYIFGANRDNGGVIVYDLNSDPWNPTEVASYEDFYVHDGMAKNNILYLSHISNGFFRILDVTEKSSPVLLGSQETTSSFTHNCWVSDDGNYLFTTDEVSGAFIDSYDISDPSDISLLDFEQSNPGSGTIVHNTHFLDSYLITSYYRDGITIHDVLNPDIMLEVGNYDTSPFSGGGFNGSWGAYPYLPSGNILATDIEEGLFILKPSYERGCYLIGNVSDASNGNPIFEAGIDIVATPVSEQSASDGDYATGIATSGLYDVSFSKPGYATQIIEDVSLTNGNTVTLDIELVPLTAFSLSGIVTNENDGSSLDGAQVIIFNDDFSYNLTSNSNGSFSVSSFLEGTYNIVVGQWGFITECFENVQIDQNTGLIELNLIPGIYDDFSFDFGWTSDATSPTGNWERAIPFGTTFQGDFSNAPNDVTGDCLGLAFVTGNNNVGNPGNDDVDDGYVELFSPIVDGSQFTSPIMSFYRWWANYDNTVANDQLEIYILNGIDEVLLVSFDANDEMSEWIFEEFVLEDYIAVTSNMQLKIRTADDLDNGSLVEAGIDLFRVVEGFVGIDEQEMDVISLFPNPTKGTIFYQSKSDKNLIFSIRDVSGKILYESVISGNGSIDIDLANGLYLVSVQENDRVLQEEKIVIIK